MNDWIQRLLGRSDIYFGGSLYMRRWRFVHLPWFGIRVHHIVRSDADRELHDHPFTFVSVILAGGYWEWTVDGQRTWYGPGSIVVRSGEALHRLELPPSFRRVHARPPIHQGEQSAWTIVFRGPLRRTWGFLTAAGWVDWQTFVRDRCGVENRNQPFSAPSSL